MMKNTRRNFLKKLSNKTVAITGLTLLPSVSFAYKKEEETAPNIVQVLHIHGSQGRIEGIPHNGKSEKRFFDKVFDMAHEIGTAGFHTFGSGSTMPGNSIALKGKVAATALSTEKGMAFFIWDRGTENKNKSGEFWVHYAITTPVILNNKRQRFKKVRIKSSSSEALFYISSIWVHDAEKRIFNKDNLKLWGPTNHHVFEVSPIPLDGPLNISIKIKGERVDPNLFLIINAVGIELV